MLWRRAEWDTGRNAGDREQLSFKVRWLGKVSVMRQPLSRCLMEMREWPTEYPGPVYLVPGRVLKKCKGPGVGAWRVPETARRPVRQDRAWERREAKGVQRLGCKGL